MITPLPSEAKPPGDQMAPPARRVDHAPTVVGLLVSTAMTQPWYTEKSPNGPPNPTYTIPLTSDSAGRCAWMTGLKVRFNPSFVALTVPSSLAGQPARSLPSFAEIA